MHAYKMHKQEERDAEDFRIASLRGTELMAAMRQGTLSCERVVAAFCRRARSISTIKTNAVTEEFYDEAVRAAKTVDAGEWSGAVSSALLQGMPMSIKDAMHMKGAVSKHYGSTLLCNIFRMHIQAGSRLRKSTFELNV